MLLLLQAGKVAPEEVMVAVGEEVDMVGLQGKSKL